MDSFAKNKKKSISTALKLSLNPSINNLIEQNSESGEINSFETSNKQQLPLLNVLKNQINKNNPQNNVILNIFL